MGISIREFARQDGCDDKLVRRALANGRLSQLRDGSMDPALVGTGWRKSNRRKIGADKYPSVLAGLDAGVDRTVNVDARAPFHLIEAERIKANYQALLLKLRYERESSAFVPVKDVRAIISCEYDEVRKHFLRLPDRVAARLAMIDRPDDASSFLQAAVVRILEELSEQ